MSGILFNMFLLKKNDIEKFNKVFNTITTVLENIYSETKTMSRTLNNLNGSIKKISNINGNINSLSTVKNRDLNELKNLLRNRLIKKGVVKGLDISAALLKSTKLALAANTLRYGFAANSTLNAFNSMASFARKRYQDNYAPIDALSSEVNQPFKKMDALANTFKIKAGVELDSLGNFLVGLKNGATFKGSEIDETLKEQGIAIYDENGNMNDMVTVLSKLANKLENMNEQKATAVKLALGMDSDTFNFLRKGQENFDISYLEQEKHAREERPMGGLLKETEESQARWEQAKEKVKSIFSVPFEWVGERWTAGQNKIRDTATDIIMNTTSADVGKATKGIIDITMPAVGGALSLYNWLFGSSDTEESTAAGTVDNNISKSLIDGKHVMSTAQQSSQVLLNAGAQASISHNNRVSNQNTFNIVSNNPEEVGRVVEEKIRTMSKQAEESFDDGVLA